MNYPMEFDDAMIDDICKELQAIDFECEIEADLAAAFGSAMCLTAEEEDAVVEQMFEELVALPQTEEFKETKIQSVKKAQRCHNMVTRSMNTVKRAVKKAVKPLAMKLRDRR